MKAALNPALRKAAVLISALDAAQADALLEQMGPERAAKVRAAAMELDETPVDETAAVIAEFVRGGGRDPRSTTAAGSHDEVVLHLSPAAETRAASAAAAAPAPADSAEPPFAFLYSAPAELLARTLAGEHPQTLALVIAHLPPHLAAAVLERLPPALAAEALARMARVAAVPHDVLHDIAQALHARLEPHLRGPTSLGNLSAVLGAVAPQAREKLLSSLARRDHGLVRELAKSAARTAGEEDARPSVAHDPHAPGAAASAAPPAPPLSLSDLAALSDAALLNLFSAAPPHVVWLVLLEADEALLARITAQLPPAEAAALRRKLSSPGPVRLRDIDAAKSELGQLARRLLRI